MLISGGMANRRSRGGRQAEQAVAGLLDRHREEDRRQAGDDADHDRHDQKHLALAQAELLRARDGVAHFASAACRRPIRANARSRVVAGPQRLTSSCSRRSIRSTPVSTVSCSSTSRVRQLRLERLGFAIERRRCRAVVAVLDAGVHALMDVGDVGDEPPPAFCGADADRQRIARQHQVHQLSVNRARRRHRRGRRRRYDRARA